MKCFFIFIILYACLATLSYATPLVQLKEHFDSDQNFQVNQDEQNYYILSSSPFKDEHAKRSLALLSKASLYKFIENTDANITGLEITGFTIKKFYEENDRLFAIAIVKKRNVIPLFEKDIQENYKTSIIDEIYRLENQDPKNRIIHEQLKELYFLSGDVDNFEKQSDILMEIIFNEN